MANKIALMPVGAIFLFYILYIFLDFIPRKEYNSKNYDYKKYSKRW